MAPDIDPFSHRALLWAARLGEASGGTLPDRPQPLPGWSAGGSSPIRFSPVLANLLRRLRESEQARDKLRANEFPTGT